MLEAEYYLPNATYSEFDRNKEVDISYIDSSREASFIIPGIVHLFEGKYNHFMEAF